MTRFPATVAAAVGFEAPLYAEAPVDWIASTIRCMADGPFDRLLIFNADCVPMWQYRKRPQLFVPVIQHTLLTIPMCAVLPTVTPVNFATMYTGASPDVHGIRAYEKPIVKIDTLFDAARRSGKRVALISLYEVGSMTRIFKERDLDYFVANSDNEAETVTHRLIDEDNYEFISTYVMDYDYLQHRKGPESPEAMRALKDHFVRFDRIVSHVKSAWSNHNTLIIFTTDHGNHAVSSGGKLGDHGDDIPEDRHVLHFWGVVGRQYNAGTEE